MSNNSANNNNRVNKGFIGKNASLLHENGARNRQGLKAMH